MATAQTATPADPVATARDHYNYARFEEAVALLQPLADGVQLQGKKLLEAKEILARSYVKLGNPTAAKSWFQSLLRQDPTWRPDPNWVPADEQAVFNAALAEMPVTQAPPPPPGVTPTERPAAAPPPRASDQAEDGGSVLGKWWLWAGIGAAAVIVAILAGGGGGGDGDEDLPLPPPPPAR
jgi:hypothetical protein